MMLPHHVSAGPDKGADEEDDGRFPRHGQRWQPHSSRRTGWLGFGFRAFGGFVGGLFFGLWRRFLGVGFFTVVGDGAGSACRCRRNGLFGGLALGLSLRASASAACASRRSRAARARARAAAASASASAASASASAIKAMVSAFDVAESCGGSFASAILLAARRPHDRLIRMSHAATIARARTDKCRCPPVRHRSPCRMSSRPDPPASPHPTSKRRARERTGPRSAHRRARQRAGVAAIGQVSVCLPRRRLPVGCRRSHILRHPGPVRTAGLNRPNPAVARIPVRVQPVVANQHVRVGGRRDGQRGRGKRKAHCESLHRSISHSLHTRLPQI